MLSKYKYPLIKLLPLMLLAAPEAKGATSFIIQIVVDNDFAFYAGTESTLTRELYQNQVGWPSQVAAASTFNFELQSGELYLYVLAMGGGGNEDISGRINNTNIVQAFFNDNNAVRVSSPVTGFLTGHDSGAIAGGSFTPQFVDVQAALSSPPTWSAPSVNTTQTVINNNPFADISGTRYGFAFDGSTSVLYRFNPQAFDIVPEPSSFALLGLGMASWLCRRKR